MEAVPTTPGHKRPLTVDDLLRLEELGEVALSPDGQWLAYVLKRPRSMAKFHKYDFLDGGDRGDVFVVESSGGTPQKLTEGAADGSGYWAPSWSPDGERLAMLSTRGGNVHLWGCDIRSGSLTRLCSRPVDAYPLFGAPSVWGQTTTCSSRRCRRAPARSEWPLRSRPPRSRCASGRRLGRACSPLEARLRAARIHHY